MCLKELKDTKNFYPLFYNTYSLLTRLTHSSCFLQYSAYQCLGTQQTTEHKGPLPHWKALPYTLPQLPGNSRTLLPVCVDIFQPPKYCTNSTTVYITTQSILAAFWFTEYKTRLDHHFWLICIKYLNIYLDILLYAKRCTWTNILLVWRADWGVECLLTFGQGETSSRKISVEPVSSENREIKT